MQYRKEEVNNKILEAGKLEYSVKGFRAGNISTIAQNAGVPVGNLYRYFDGKLGLLDAIVKPAYNEVPKLLIQMQKVQVLDSDSLEKIMPMLLDSLLCFFDKFGKELLILIDNCASTKYEDFGKDILAQVTRVVQSKLYPDPTDIEVQMATAISKAFLNSLFDLLRNDTDRSITYQMMLRLIKFYFYDVNLRK